MPKLRLSPLRRDALLMLCGGIVMRCCGLLFLMVLSRRLSQSQIGIFSFAEALADTLTIVATCSLDTVTLRSIAGGPLSEAPERFAPLLGFRLITSPVYLICIAVASLFIRDAAWWLMPVVGIYTLLESISFSFAALFIGARKFSAKVAIELIVEVVYTAAFVVGIWRYPTLATLVILGTLRSVLLVLTSMLVSLRVIGPLRVTWQPSIVRAGAPFLAMNFLGLLQGKSETVLLGFLSSYAAVGVFQLAMRLMIASTFIPHSIGLAIFPRLAADGLDAMNRRRLGRCLGLSVSLGVAGAVVLAICPELVARILYGRAGIAVGPVLRALAVAVPLRFLAMGLASALTSLGREKRVLRSLIFCTTAGIVTDLALVPRLAETGAAIGTAVTALCQCWVLGHEMLHLLGQTSSRAIARGDLSHASSAPVPAV